MNRKKGVMIGGKKNTARTKKSKDKKEIHKIRNTTIRLTTREIFSKNHTIKSEKKAKIFLLNIKTK